MSSAKCEVCGADVEGGAGKLCASCNAKAGLQPAEPPARGKFPCLRCGGLSFVRAQMRERTTQSGGSRNDEITVPFAITYAQGQEFKGGFSLKQIPSATPDTAKPFGCLYTFVCRACGFVEWVAQSPDQIPISAVCGTDLVEVGSEPYR